MTESQIARRRLTLADFKLIRKWSGGTGKLAEIAKNVARQGWISEKQRAVLQRGGEHHACDYDESDYDIGAFELCVDGWGD